ncbi:hybrid sensor histidine kinase/response regulator [Paucibacter sp. R3-3]|uniref:histidine kinase n=2 Tax=Roseateles agri TaxID=3098619 RepID=A0ABU5DEE6_9BURK|nr:hybrid sensor histidine kinase/response regulator [Paucibacter sp. R3-3]
MAAPALRPSPLDMLLLEDSALDAELLRAHLAISFPQAQLTWVTDAAGFSSELAARRFDLILSDFQLPDYNGGEALDHARRVAPQTPFIFLSGVIGEENAVELLKRGATDYIMKGRLARLPLVIERALREVDQRAAELRAQEALRQAKDEAERTNALKDQFLAIVSHELRSPLSAIQGWAELLALRANGDGLMEKASAVIKRNALLQTRMIDDLLDMTAVVAGKLALQCETLDLSALAEAEIATHQQEAQARDIRLGGEYTAAAWVSGDGQRLAQVIGKLVGNALKFSNAQGQILVRIQQDGGEVALVVEDFGRGISADFLPHVFDRLRQEDSSRTRSAGGLGLGLAIADAVVRLHGGRISASSEGVDRGARFEVRLPAVAAPAVQPNGHRAPDDEGIADLSGLHVLLVDDERDARDVGRATLESLGAAVTVAASTQEALAELSKQDFDVLVSDLGMPGQDGLSLVRALRAGGHQPGLPAVALTAFAMLPDRRAALDAGFDGHVTKPIDRKALGDAVRAALRTATPK